MAKTYRPGPGRRAINVPFTVIQAGLAGRSYYLLAGPCEKLAVTRQEALALRKAAGWVRRALSAG